MAKEKDWKSWGGYPSEYIGILSPSDCSMIPCYFTLEELKHIKHYVEACEDHYEEGDIITFNILENLDGKISNEERKNDANRG